jgi:hypothetical protein
MILLEVTFTALPAWRRTSSESTRPQPYSETSVLQPRRRGGHGSAGVESTRCWRRGARGSSISTSINTGVAVISRRVDHGLAPAGSHTAGAATSGPRFGRASYSAFGDFGATLNWLMSTIGPVSSSGCSGT